jgi:heptosyltransferase II
MRTLILSPRAVSEAVMTQPLVSLIRRFDPGGRIDVLAGPYVAPVYRAMADVDHVIASRHAFGPVQPLGKLLLSRRIDRHRHDRALVLASERWSALLPWLVGIPIRIGMARDTSWRIVNRPLLAPDDGRSPVERYARLAFDSMHAIPTRIPDPVLARDPDREQAARANAGVGRDEPLLLLCVGTDGSPSRRWPARHFASIAAMATAQWPGIAIAMLGSAGDRQFGTEIAALSGQPLRNLCGSLLLADAIALIAQARGVLAGDTGLSHVAAAYSKPMVALFGPTDPRRSAPRAPRTGIEWLRLECSPCNEATCRLGHNACMSQIRPESVFQSLRRAMQFEVRDFR